MNMNMKKLPDGFSLAPVRTVKPGRILICDGGFTCNKAGAQRMVFRDKDPKRVIAIPGKPGKMKPEPMHSRERLYVRCKDGRHYLEGQLSETGTHYVGFWLSPKQRY